MPENPASVNWIRLEQVSQRLFPAGGTEGYLVTIDVPADAPAGQYSFRLDMARWDHPEEGDAIGPSVEFQVLPAKPARVARRFPWSIFGR